MKRAKQKINTLEIVAQPSKSQFRLGPGRAQTIHSAIAAAFFQFPILNTEYRIRFPISVDSVTLLLSFHNQQKTTKISQSLFTIMMMMMMKLSLSLLLLFLLSLSLQQQAALGSPIAPTTLDGATPIDAQVSAADFGALDAFAEDAAENSQAAASEAGFKISLLPPPAETAESVNLEHEAIPSKVLSAYDNTQKKLSDISHPVPILDGISEHEKYGNNGDKFDGISRSLVNGYEAFSNILNALIQKPKDIARSVSKGITAQLDIIGGKLVGL